MHLTQIFIYPLKSGAACDSTEHRVESKGLEGDRTWMVVGHDGAFITARTHPRLTLVGAYHGVAGTLHLSAPDMPSMEALAQQEPLDVTIWSDRVHAVPAQPDANKWMSRYLGVDCRLVYQPSAFKRPIDQKTGIAETHVSFADAYPLLLISQASLDGLNERLDTPISMNRFRTNLVVDGVEPHAEDQWKRIRIGRVEFHCCEPCERCVLTTVDPMRGERDPTGEPLRTLATYRRGEKGVLFGMNLVPVNGGTITVSDSITVLE